MEQADDTPITYRADTEETTQATTQATQATQATEGEVMNHHTKETLDAIVLGLAQNAILAGLIIITAGVPTW